MTSICIPSAGVGGLDDQVGEHFGRVPTYTIIELESGDVRVLENTSEHAGGAGLPADILSEAGIDVLLCQGAGRRAMSILNEQGIEVCIGASGTVKQALEEWKEGTLHSATDADACQRHAFHDHSS